MSFEISLGVLLGAGNDVVSRGGVAPPGAVAYADAIAGGDSPTDSIDFRRARTAGPLFGATWITEAANQEIDSSFSASMLQATKDALNAAGDFVFTVTFVPDASGVFAHQLFLSPVGGGTISANGQYNAGDQSVSFEAPIQSFAVRDVSAQFGESAGTVLRAYAVYTAAAASTRAFVNFNRQNTAFEYRDLAIFARDTFDADDAVMGDQIAALVPSGVSAPVAAPTAAGNIADQTFTRETGVQAVATAQDFTGSDLTYSLTTTTSGVTINSASGVVSVDTAVATVQSATSIVVRATNSAGNVSSGFSLTVQAAVVAPPPAGAITFGTNTRTGEGAASIAATDGTYGQFTVANGVMTSNISPLTVGTTDVDGIDVTVLANARTVATEEELRLVVNGTHTTASGETCYIRNKGSVYALKDIFFSDIWTGHPSNITFAGADPDNMPEIDFWDLRREATANVTFRHLTFTKLDYPTTSNFFGPISWTQQPIIACDGTPGINGLTFEDCVFDGGLIPWRDGGRFNAQNPVIAMRNSTITNFVFRRNTVRHVSTPLVIGIDGFVIEDNTFEKYHNDGIILKNSATTDCANGVIRNNHFTEQVGWPVQFHSDFIQLQPQTGETTSIHSLEIYGNTSAMGPVVQGSQADPINARSILHYGPNETTGVVNGIEFFQASTLALDGTHHAREVRFSDNTAVTLPPAASSAGMQFALRGSSGTPAATVNLAGTDAWEGGSDPVTLNQSETVTFYSDGTSEWKQMPGNYRHNFVLRTASKTLGTLENNCLTVVNANAGNVTLTLPDNGDLELAVSREDGSSNTVTIVPSAGDTLIHNGSSVASLSFVQGYGVNIVGNGAGTWTVTERGALTQGFFGNAQTNETGTYRDITFHSNILYVTAGAGIRIEQDVDRMHSYNNTILIPYFADQNGDGVIGRYEANAATEFVGSINIGGTDAWTFRDLAAGQLLLNNYSADGQAIDTVTANVAGRSNVYTALSTYLVNAEGTAYQPTTRAEVVASAETRTGVTQGAWAHYDFSAGAPRTTLDRPVITTTSTPVDDNLAASTPLSLTFNHFIQAGTGNVTIYNETDGAVVETFNVATGAGSATGSIVFSGRGFVVTGGADWPAGKTISLRYDATAIVSSAYGTTAAAVTGNAFKWPVVGNANAVITFVDAFSTGVTGVTQTVTGTVFPAGKSVVFVGRPQSTAGPVTMTVGGVAATSINSSTRNALTVFAFEIDHTTAGARDIVVNLGGFSPALEVAVYGVGSASVITSNGYAAGGGGAVEYVHAINTQQGQGVIAMAMLNLTPASGGTWAIDSGWNTIDANNNLSGTKATAVMSAQNVGAALPTTFRATSNGGNQDKTSLAIVLG